MKFLQVALLFTFVMLMASVIYGNPKAADLGDEKYCYRDDDCQKKDSYCYCQFPRNDTSKPGVCDCKPFV